MLSGWLRPFTAGDGWLCPIRAQVSRSRRRRCHQRPLTGGLIVRRVPAVHCRIEPLLDQGGASRRRWPGVSGRALPLGGPPAARRAALTGRADPLARMSTSPDWRIGRTPAQFLMSVDKNTVSQTVSFDGHSFRTRFPGSLRRAPRGPSRSTGRKPPRSYAS